MLQPLVPTLLAIAMIAAAQEPTRPDIRALLDASGLLAAQETLFQLEAIEAQTRAIFKPENAPPPERAKMERFIHEFAKEFSAEVKGKRAELTDLIVAICVKYYTPEDIQALLKFYETPVGKKMAAVSGKAAIESMQAGQSWGQVIGQKVGARVGQRIEAESAKQP